MPSPVRAVIIDDEKLGREIVKKYLAERDDIEIASECSNGFEGVKKINEEKPDLVFLDIQMPRINGFEMLELIEEHPVIIFTTAYDHYAIKAFEVNAADYLLKPFSKERFDEALNKAFAHLKNKKEITGIIDKLIKHNEKNEEYLERIVIKNGSQIIVIPVNEVKWFEAQDDYVMIHSERGKYLKQKTMQYFEDHLDPKDFIRIHRSYIISIKEITKIELLEKESYQVKIDNKFLPVSRNGYKRLREIIK